jgi:hypothetical protein
MYEAITAEDDVGFGENIGDEVEAFEAAGGESAAVFFDEVGDDVYAGVGDVVLLEELTVVEGLALVDEGPEVEEVVVLLLVEVVGDEAAHEVHGRGMQGVLRVVGSGGV